MSKYQTAAGRLNRAVTKAATQCGCISLSGKKREGQAKTNVSGKLCKNCREAIEKEMGDVLFSAANVSRLLKADPEEALTRSTEKFIRRFHRMEQAAISNDIELSECTIDELNDLWREAKKAEKIIGCITT